MYSIFPLEIVYEKLIIYEMLLRITKSFNNDINIFFTFKKNVRMYEYMYLFNMDS